VQFVQKIQIDVRDKNHFGVRGSLGSASVCRECEITGGKNSRLGILNIHVVYFGQVAYATGYDYEAFVLDGTGMCADSYTGIGVLGIGEERNEQYLHTFAGHDSGEFGELDIVTNQDSDFGAVGLESPNGFTAAQSPAFHFVGGDM